MEEFNKTIIALYGSTGKQWLADLPILTEKLATKWKLSDLKPVENLSYNYILWGFRGIEPIILKICPDPQEPGEELQALQMLAGRSLPRVLEHDLASGAFLLERTVPGTMFDETFPEDDSKATHIFCDLVEGFPRITASNTLTFDLHAKWFTVLDDTTSQVPEKYLHKARTLEKLLIATAPQPLILCHADLHHGNILKNGDSWITIDPFLAFGELAFEASHFLWNPYRLLHTLPNDELKNILRKRLLIIAQRLRIDPERVQRWCFVRAVNAWAWFCKSDRGTKEIEQLVKFFDPLTPMDLNSSSDMLQD